MKIYNIFIPESDCYFTTGKVIPLGDIERHNNWYEKWIHIPGEEAPRYLEQHVKQDAINSYKYYKQKWPCNTNIIFEEARYYYFHLLKDLDLIDLHLT
tara:strand:- start:178 stop:471 length:294 start_codon:yes stop_codon:yes gene_type:complete